VSERKTLGTARASRAARPTPGTEPAAAMRARPRTLEMDREWVRGVTDEDLRHHIFQRVSAKDILFQHVDFRYSTFENSYLRSCRFDSCDFTGCKFVGSSFHGSTFAGCTFDYALFERTLIDSDVLDTCAPNRENLRQRFARTLRTNYQALGDSDSVNKAILVELRATRVHKHKAWRSNEPYYRSKYPGLARVGAFLGWLGFVVGDVIWGNGERAFNLGRTLFALVLLLAILDTIVTRDPMLVADWAAAIVDAPQVFIGTKDPAYPGIVVAGIALLRYVMLGLFVSVLVRRYARR
jgi:hypothetical protein